MAVGEILVMAVVTKNGSGRRASQGSVLHLFSTYTEKLNPALNLAGAMV